MKVLNAKIDWMRDWDNDPHLQLLVDKLPNLDDLRFEERQNHYFAELDGYVRFFHYVRPDQGYGGAVFNLAMKDGSHRELIGPWSSNSTAMTRMGFTPSIEVSFTDSPEDFHRGYTLYAGSVTVELAQQAIRQYCPTAELIPVLRHTTPDLSGEQSAVVLAGLPGGELCDAHVIVRAGLTWEQSQAWKRAWGYVVRIKRAAKALKSSVSESQIEWLQREIEYSNRRYREILRDAKLPKAMFDPV